MLKGSILAYFLAGALTVTAVTVGVTVVVNKQNEKAKEAESVLEEFETDVQGNYIGPNGEKYNADEIVKLVEEGSLDSISNNSRSSLNNQETNMESKKETEAPTEVAADVVEFEGVTIEGVLGVEEISDDELVIEYSADDFRYSDSSTTSNSDANETSSSASNKKIKETSQSISNEETIESEAEAAIQEPETENPSEVAAKQEIAKYEEIKKEIESIQESIRESKAKVLESVDSIEEGEGGGQ